MSHLLLDIDGVLNPFLHADPWNAGYDVCRNPWTTWLLHPMHGEALQRLRERGHKLVWATSWEEEADAVCQFYEIAPFDETIMFGTDSALHGEPKLASIQNYCQRFPQERIVWVEDEVTDMLVSHTKDIANLQIVHCDPRHGWTKAKIRETLEGLES